jgi:hypothetical protein
MADCVNPIDDFRPNTFIEQHFFCLANPIFCAGKISSRRKRCWRAKLTVSLPHDASRAGTQPHGTG